jgi:hypothetical protein
MSARERLPRVEPPRPEMQRDRPGSSDHGHAAAHHGQHDGGAHRHTVFESSALAGGLGTRLAVAAAAVALLWLTIGWALS